MCSQNYKISKGKVEFVKSTISQKKLCPIPPSPLPPLLLICLSFPIENISWKHKLLQFLSFGHQNTALHHHDLFYIQSLNIILMVIIIITIIIIGIFIIIKMMGCLQDPTNTSLWLTEVKASERVALGHFHERVDESPQQDWLFIVEICVR